MQNPDPDIVSLPFISAYTFRSLADHGLVAESTINCFMSRLPNGIDPSAVKPGDMIYISSDLIEVFFRDIGTRLDVPYVLISGLRDREVDEPTASLISDNVIRWYTQNNSSSHPRVSTIPIGLQNMYWQSPDDFQGDVGLLSEIASEVIEPSKNILMSFTVSSNPSTRGACREHFLRQKNIVTVRDFDPVSRTERNVAADHFREIRRHKFVVSPFGRGLDCFRNWETFSLGSIPIIQKHKSMEAFYDMPAWFVEDWSEVDEYSMNKKYDEMKSNWDSFNHEKRLFRYWQRLLVSST